jgi:hypothetical protein
MAKHRSKTPQDNCDLRRGNADQTIATSNHFTAGRSVFIFPRALMNSVRLASLA